MSPAPTAAKAPGEPGVRIRGLVKRYGGRTVLDGIDLDVGRGEVVALLGPNGAGKTTTVEIVEGYRAADGGDVRVLGEDPQRGGRELRARVGLMLQGGGFDPRARPAELVRLHAAFFADPRDPDELLALVGLDAVARTPYRRLSGGERQRLSLAVALVGRPELLILDEPTAGMDPAARADTRDLIAGLRAGGTTILLTTHDLTDVERLADRVAIVHGGRIVAEGAPGELGGGGVGGGALEVRLEPRPDPAALDRLAAGVGGARPGARIAPGARFGDPAGGTDDVIRIDGWPPDPALVELVARWAAEERLLVTELRTAGRSLEERYLELTAAEHGPGPTGEPDPVPGSPRDRAP